MSRTIRFSYLFISFFSFFARAESGQDLAELISQIDDVYETTSTLDPKLAQEYLSTYFEKHFLRIPPEEAVKMGQKVGPSSRPFMTKLVQQKAHEMSTQSLLDAAIAAGDTTYTDENIIKVGAQLTGEQIRIISKATQYDQTSSTFTDFLKKLAASHSNKMGELAMVHIYNRHPDRFSEIFPEITSTTRRELVGQVDNLLKARAALDYARSMDFKIPEAGMKRLIGKLSEDSGDGTSRLIARWLRSEKMDLPPEKLLPYFDLFPATGSDYHRNDVVRFYMTMKGRDLDLDDFLKIQKEGGSGNESDRAREIENYAMANKDKLTGNELLKLAANTPTNYQAGKDARKLVVSLAASLPSPFCNTKGLEKVASAK
jgi:hypothetical protein